VAGSLSFLFRQALATEPPYLPLVPVGSPAAACGPAANLLTGSCAATRPTRGGPRGYCPGAHHLRLLHHRSQGLRRSAQSREANVILCEKSLCRSSRLRYSCGRIGGGQSPAPGSVRATAQKAISCYQFPARDAASVREKAGNPRRKPQVSPSLCSKTTGPDSMSGVVSIISARVISDALADLTRAK